MDIPTSEIAAFIVAMGVAGALTGFMAGLFGIGGGAILVPVFYQVFTTFGIEEAVRMHLSVGSSLAVIVATSLRSWRAHFLRDAVDMALLRSFIFAVPAGVIAASFTAAHISSRELMAIFSGILFIVGLRLLLNRHDWRIGTAIPGNPLRSIVGFVIGFLSTLMGIGGGVLNNTFMTLFGRSMHQAVATSSGVGVLISIPGVFGYIWAGWGVPDLPIASTGYVNWIAVLTVVPVTLLAAPLGVQVAHKMNKRALEITFGIFAMIVSARFLFEVI